MDLVRSCYQQTMQFGPDPSQRCLAKWYFCKKSAKAFPFPHAFGSPAWDTYHPTITSIGFDATSARTYYNGSLLNSSDGTSFAGPGGYFVDGSPLGVPALPRGMLGTPLDCLRRPLGKAKGGYCGKTPDTLLCPACRKTPSAVVVRAEGFQFPWGFLNGQHILTRTLGLGCDWEKFFPDGSEIFAQRNTGFAPWVCTYAPATVLGNVYAGGHETDCQVRTDIPLVAFSFPGPGAISIQGVFP